MKNQSKILTAGFLAYLTIALIVPLMNFVHKGSFWEISAEIEIDDANPMKDWAYYASTYSWCSGSGSSIDPYIIENVTIYSSGSYGIRIKNSETPYWVLSNVTIIGGGNGIEIINSKKGVIWKCNITSYDRGIYLQNSQNNVLWANIISGVVDGIYMDNSHSNLIAYNIISEIDEAGIILHGCTENWLFGNEISNNLGGIVLIHSILNQIELNLLYNNSYVSIMAIGGSDIRIIHNTLSNSEMGIVIVEGTYQLVESNQLNNIDRGIIIFDTTLSNVSLNSIEFSTYEGIWIAMGMWNNLNANNISNCDVGLLLDDSVSNNITNSIFRDNEIGLFINNSCEDNYIFMNGFINELNAVDDNILGINYFDNGTIGNFWDDYEGEDLDEDGIGDTPYEVSGSAGSQDNYPLMEYKGIVIEPEEPEEPEEPKIPSSPSESLRTLFAQEPDRTIFIVLLGCFSIPTIIYIAYHLRNRKARITELKI